MGNTSVDNDKDTSAEAVNYVRKRSSSKHVFIGILVVALVAALGYMLLDRMKLSKEVDKLSQSQKEQVSAPDEAKQLDTEVRKLIEISADEAPSIATVADAEKLKQQSTGFDSAKIGDKLLIYTRAKQIVVYRPSTKKVVSIVQISLGQNTSTPGTTQKKQ